MHIDIERKIKEPQKERLKKSRLRSSERGKAHRWGLGVSDRSDLQIIISQWNTPNQVIILHNNITLQ